MRFSASEIIRALGGNEHSGLCLCPSHDDKNPSLHVSESDGVTLFYCHAGCSQDEVINALQAHGLWGRPTTSRAFKPRPVSEHGSAKDGPTEAEMEAWAIHRAAADTEEQPTAYLRKRGITLEVPKCLKLLSPGVTAELTGKRYPAMVAPISNAADKLQGAHVTWLTADAAEKLGVSDENPRRMYGRAKGGYAQLGVIDPDKPLIVGEGIETTLSAAQLTGLPGLAVLSASNFSSVELPPCSEVIVAADNDPPGREAAEALARKLAGRGQTVRIALPPGPEGGDWNDALRSGVDHNQLREMLLHAECYTKSPQETLLLPSADFVESFVPPDYLVDGILQRQFLYALTGHTGDGKTLLVLRIAAHVAFGLPLAGHDVEQGTVLFLAGENPDDVCMRYIKLCEEMEIDPKTENVVWCRGGLKLSDEELRKRIDAETKARGPFALIIVDTSAAFFEGDDENSNTQLGNHARTLRSLVNIFGGPTILVTCHPAKNATRDDLVPRGGGAFLNEVDGNLTCAKQANDTSITELHWNRKFRGPDFAPISFKITAGTTALLKDSKGRPIWTVTAEPVSDAEKASVENEARRRQEEVLSVIANNPELSLADIARELDWTCKDGEPDKTKVYRTLKALKAAGEVEHKHGRWSVTKSARAAKKMAA